MTLVDRDHEMRKLSKVFGEVAAGSRSAVLVTGPASSGKTALLHAFLRTARAAGAVVLEAVGSPVFQSQPLVTLRRLMESAPAASAARPLVASGGRAAPLPASASTSAAAGEPGRLGVEPTALEFCETLTRLAVGTPVVLCVDDVQHADAASIEILVALLHQCRSVHAMVLFAERTGLALPNAALDRLMPYADGVHRIELAMLSQVGASRLAAEFLDPGADARIAEDWYRTTGGNPVLIRALADDYRAAADGGRDESFYSDEDSAFARAVLRCLRRCDREIIKTAQALALLGDHGTAPVLGRLVGVSVECAHRALRVLTAMGLVECGRLRSRAVAAAVRAGLSPADRRELRLRAAKCLYDDGTSAGIVAELVEAAGGVRAGWAVHVLRESAQKRLATGDVATAVSHLKLAQQASEDDRQWTAATIDLVRAQWRQDPAAASRHVADLAAAVREQRLAGADALVPARYLLWYGHLDEAVDLIERADDTRTRSSDDEFETQLEAVRYCIGCLYPSPDRAALPAVRRPKDNGEPEVAAHVESAVVPSTRLAAALADSDRSPLGLDLPPHHAPLSDPALAHAAASLTMLLYIGRLDEAAQRCGRLREQAAARRVSTWHAIFCAFQGEIALRQGDAAEAERYARAALILVGLAGWGVAIGGPVSTLIAALTEQGRLDEAAGQLDRELPGRMFQTLVGPHFLAARGSFHLASRAPRAALADFEYCGELLAAWGFDLPGVVPWRLGAATAYLRLGRRKSARRLVQAQLEMLDSRFPRLRALALELDGELDGRLRAPMTAARRPEAVASAPASQLPARPEPGNGGPRRPWLATGLAAEDRERRCTGLGGAAKEHRASLLSSAEQRVAELVSAGESNREIARKLFITVSTVEQHLTRIYRKLGVSGRSELHASRTASS